MRLFIAINFDKKVKSLLINNQNKLKEYAESGNFTKEENLHLTLVFLGEVGEKRLPILKQIMDSVNISPFTISIGGVGNFRRDNGDIWWTGIEENNNLSQLQSQLCEGLSKNNFQVERHKFTPHLTLARQVRLNNNFDKKIFSKYSNVDFTVNTICLMQSQHINRKLTYMAICEKQL